MRLGLNSCFIVNASTKFFNTRIDNLSPVPKIKWILLAEAIISSKISPLSGSKRHKRSNIKVKNEKTMPEALLLIGILCIKQQGKIRWCFLQFKI